MKRAVSPFPCLCGSRQFSEIFALDAAPGGRSPFASILPRDCRRRILRCGACGHFVSTHNVDPKALYAGDYVTSTYGNGGIERAYRNILSLPPEKSDNRQRVKRVLQFSRKHLAPHRTKSRKPSLLDVGSGLCVFLKGMKKAGWDCTALDPDFRAADHARSTVGVKAIHGDFERIRPPGRFDLVSFNKVLEHVPAPTALLARSRACLTPHGLVYVEVPDGERAIHAGPDREEFFIDHFHIFSFASLALLTDRSGFFAIQSGRLVEPSGKRTLYAFLTAKEAA